MYDCLNDAYTDFTPGTAFFICSAPALRGDLVLTSLTHPAALQRLADLARTLSYRVELGRQLTVYDVSLEDALRIEHAAGDSAVGSITLYATRPAHHS